MTQFSKTVVALVLGLAAAGVAVAQPTPTTEKEPAKATPGGPISDVQLGEMLEGLGVEFTRGTYKSGALYFDTKVATKDYDFNVRVGLSPNKRTIWLMSYLDDVPEN